MTKNPRVPVTLEQNIYDQVSRYRDKYGFSSQSKASQELIRIGLKYCEQFRRNVALKLEGFASEDVKAWRENGGNYERLVATAEGSYPLTAESVREIADDLGESIADLIKDPDAPETEESPGVDDTTPRDDREREFIRLLRNADEVHRNLAAEILRAAVRNEQSATKRT